MQAHGDAHHVHGQHVEHRALHGDHRAVGCGAQEVGQVVDVRLVHAAADGHPVHHQRALVDAAADHAFDGLEAVDVVALELALDARGREAADVLFHPAGVRGHDHVPVGRIQPRVAARQALEVVQPRVLGHVHLRGVDGHRDLVGPGRELGQHVARVVAEPLGGGTVVLGREADGAAHLDDHLGHARTHAGDQFVEHRQALAALAVGFAHMQVQHGGAGFVAVDRLLDLLFHRDRNVFRKVGGNPPRRIGRGRDDQGLLVLGIEVAVEEVHEGLSPVGRWF
ncbi:hypothetical protein D9M68_583760 [compost metagenome]